VSWPHRIRNIALSQLRAIKERLDRIDAEIDDERLRYLQARSAAERELADDVVHPRVADARAGTVDRDVDRAQASTASADAPAPQGSPLHRYYKVLGLADGASMAEIDAAYEQLTERCGTLDGTEGSEESQIVTEIRARVDEAYAALREALNPTAGRFDKLEI
jgi:multidrug resistance efflux pump